MRKELIRAVRATFRQAIESGGRFEYTKERGAAGSDIYIWRFSADLNFFLYLLPSLKSYHDRFIIELGWSTGHAFPAKAALQNKQRLDLKSDGRIRLPSLWREKWKSAVEPWWKLGDSLVESGDAFDSEDETRRRLAQVPEVVSEVVDKLGEYGMPFFQRIAEERRATPSPTSPHIR